MKKQTKKKNKNKQIVEIHIYIHHDDDDQKNLPTPVCPSSVYYPMYPNHTFPLF